MTKDFDFKKCKEIFKKRKLTGTKMILFVVNDWFASKYYKKFKTTFNKIGIATQFLKKINPHKDFQNLSKFGKVVQQMSAKLGS